MRKTQRFFRIVWRINAIFILAVGCVTAIGIGGVTMSGLLGGRASRQSEQAAPPIAGKDADRRLVLGSFSLVEGTSVYRAQLVDDPGGKEWSIRSSYDGVPRNILFIDSVTGNAWWLRESNEQIITYTQDIIAEAKVEPHGRRAIASLALAKPVTDNPGKTEGQLLLFDPASHDVQNVADKVRAVYGAELSSTGDIVVLYEHSGKYVLGQFDGSTLRKKADREVAVPPLK
jgi:hypothetical protein